MVGHFTLENFEVGSNLFANTGEAGEENNYSTTDLTPDPNALGSVA